MIVGEEFLKQIRTIFELNIYEAKVWTALLSRGIASAGELADISNVPRSRSYDVLESLEKKGFIVMKLGKPIKYIAVKPDEILIRVKRKVEVKAVEDLKTLDKVKDTNIYQDIELLYKQGIDKIEVTDLSGLLKGRKNIYDHLKTLINNAENSVVLVTTETGFLRKMETLKSTLKRANDRGVQIKISAPVEKGKVSAELKKYAEIKNVDKQSARFVIIDGKQVLFMVSDDKDVHETYDTGVWVNTPFFAQALESMFETSWKTQKAIA